MCNVGTLSAPLRKKPPWSQPIAQQPRKEAWKGRRALWWRLLCGGSALCVGGKKGSTNQGAGNLAVTTWLMKWAPKFLSKLLVPPFCACWVERAERAKDVGAKAMCHYKTGAFQSRGGGGVRKKKEWKEEQERKDGGRGYKDPRHTHTRVLCCAFAIRTRSIVVSSWSNKFTGETLFFFHKYDWVFRVSSREGFAAVVFNATPPRTPSPSPFPCYGV